MTDRNQTDSAVLRTFASQLAPDPGRNPRRHARQLP